MTGMTRSSAGLEARRRRALYRAWHRGTREADLILGSFADREIATLDEEELAEFECLLDQPDGTLMEWITGKVLIPTDLDTALLKKICNSYLSARSR